MSHFNIVHEVECPLSRYWDIFFDEAYNQALYARIGVKERRWLEMKDGPTTRSWVLRIIPQRDLPEFVKKIVKGDLGYVETSTLDKATNAIDCHIEPTLLKDKTKIHAIYKIEEIAPGRLRRSFAGDITVGIPLVGRKIEQFIISDIDRSYELTARFTSEWARSHPA
jgi:hypothetical protein